MTQEQASTSAARPWWLADAPFAFGWASTGAILGVVFGWWSLLVIFGLALFVVIAPIRYRGGNRAD